MDDIFAKIGGTKFTGFIFITILGFFLIIFRDSKTATDFMTFSFGMFGLYVLGNVGSKLVEEEKEPNETMKV